MKRLPIIACMLCLTTATVFAQDDYVSDDGSRTTGGLWTELGATKLLPYNFSLGLDAGFRTNEWFDEANRYDISLGLDWKPTKHWKFGVSYTFLMKHYPVEKEHKTEYKYRPAGESDNTDFTDFMGAPSYNDGTTAYTYKGKNINRRTTEQYWRAKHRFSFDASYTNKLWKTLRITLRERYQLTLVPSKVVNREKVIDKYRDMTYSQATITNEDDVTYDEQNRYWQEGEAIYCLDLTDANATREDVTQSYLAEHDELNPTKEKSSKTLHVLRSRLSFEIDKKGWNWTPYIYIESFNNLGESFHFDKLRLSGGVEYALTKQHKLSLGYIFNHENDDDGDMNIHAINIGYKFKF